MLNAKNILDSVVYGLDDAKMQIMQLIGLWLVNPNAIASAIAIKGPMGTGKTTLIKDGISKILNRPFSLVALGGCGDSGFIDGHDYTYEGSKYGKIIDILIQTALDPYFPATGYIVNGKIGWIRVHNTNCTESVVPWFKGYNQ